MAHSFRRKKRTTENRVHLSAKEEKYTKIMSLNVGLVEDEIGVKSLDQAFAGLAVVPASPDPADR
jgi:hypothetical protein